MPPAASTHAAFSVDGVQLETKHAPLMQLAPAAQTLPQYPQFEFDTRRSTHPAPGQQSSAVPPSPAQ